MNKGVNMKNWKKWFALVSIVALCVISCVSLVACNKKIDTQYTIIIEPFSGSGFGYQWIKDLANEWSAKNGTYKIIVKENSTALSGTQLDQIASNNTNTDVYFGAEPSYSSGFYKGYFEDLSDLLAVSPDNNGVTIQDKIIDFETWQKVAGKLSYDSTTDSFTTSGCYMLPYSVTMVGMVYDHDLWVEKNYVNFAENNAEVKAQLAAQGITYQASGKRLVFVSSTGTTNYSQGDYILTAGKDGKYGTYDDGQPQTMDEFVTLLNRIVAANGKGFIYSSMQEYASSLTLSYLVQYAGLNAYSALSTFNSNGNEIALADGTNVAIDWTNGYLAYSMNGIADAVNFTNDYFGPSSKYCTRGNYVSDAQDKFINGGLGNSTYNAMIVEGNWFEFEAAESLKSAGKQQAGKGYGQVDYRYLLMPDIDGQKGIDGNGHGSVFAAPETGAIVVRKQQYPEKLAAIKDFLAYTLTDKALSETTAKTGLIRGYKYSLTDAQLANMTPFQRTSYQIYQDTANVKVLTYATDRLTTPFAYAANGFYDGILPVGTTASVVDALRNGQSVETIISKIQNNYSKNTWEGFLSGIKNSLV